jgi:hypothetical protein
MQIEIRVNFILFCIRISKIITKMQFDWPLRQLLNNIELNERRGVQLSYHLHEWSCSLLFSCIDSSHLHINTVSGHLNKKTTFCLSRNHEMSKKILENKLLAINNKSKFSYSLILISIYHLNYNKFVSNANSCIYLYQ